MNRLPNLLQLAKDNAGQSRQLRIEASSQDEATVYLYGVIGGYWGDIQGEDFVKQLAGITASTIHLRINSPGGDVFEARAMMTALRQHPAKVVAHIDGLAASAATDIAMAADEVEISKGGFYMIHNAWTMQIGDKSDFLEAAGLLEKIDSAIADDYQARTKGDRQQIVDWMNAETWFSAEEAVEHGFADRIVEVAVSNASSWNVSAYANAPKAMTEPAAPEPDQALAARKRRLRLLAA